MNDNELLSKITSGQMLPAGLSIRYTEEADSDYLKKWLLDPEVATYFPMEGEAETEDGAKRMISFCRIHASLTAVINGVPCGVAMLYVQAYKRLVHQCEFGIVVAPEYRGKGIGTFLMKSLMRLAKERFRIELLHLQVYDDNPAIRLYRRLGFREFGRQLRWMKEKDRYVQRIFMERFL